MSLLNVDIEMIRRAMDAHAMINISDAAGRIIWVNDTFLKSTGYAEAEVLGHTITEFLIQNNSVDPAELRNALRSGSPWIGETKFMRKDGTVFWTRSTIDAALDQDGNILKTIALRTDITESKARQAELQTRTLLNELDDQVFVFTTDTLKLLYVNRCVLALHGWKDDEYQQKWLGDTVKEFDEELFRSRTAPLIAGEVSSIHYESVHNGMPVDINLQLQQGFGDRPQFIAVVRDISLRKRTDEARAQFVASVSHELRAPLTSVMGSLKLVISGAMGALSKRPTEMLGVALRNVDRLLLLLNDILDLEKLDAGKMDFHMESTNVAEIVTDSVDGIAGYGAECGVTFRTIGTERCIPIDANRDRLMQVMTNLLSNAAKFSHRGGQVDVVLAEKDQQISISVIDRGIGIPEDAQSHVFERFTQTGNAVDSRHRGTGLGLSIVQSIVDKHGGTIQLDSRKGEGTTVRVLLPIHRSGQTAAGEEQPRFPRAASD